MCGSTGPPHVFRLYIPAHACRFSSDWSYKNRQGNVMMVQQATLLTTKTSNELTVIHDSPSASRPCSQFLILLVASRRRYKSVLGS